METMGWTGFFLLCAVLAIPGMLLLFSVAPWAGEQGPALAQPAASDLE